MNLIQHYYNFRLQSVQKSIDKMENRIKEIDADMETGSGDRYETIQRIRLIKCYSALDRLDLKESKLKERLKIA